MTPRLPALLLLLCPPVAISAQADPAATIPALTADTLAGEHVRLPEDLRGKSGILVLGFSKEARTQVRDWGKRLAIDYFSSPAVLFYEMPALGGVPRLLRGVVLRQVASEVSDRGKHHFVPITEHEPRWRALAHVGDPAAAYVLVVDSAGTVLWTTSGPLSDAAYHAVQSHLPHGS